MTKYKACIYEIYQNPQEFGRWYCRVIEGTAEFGIRPIPILPQYFFERGKEIGNLPLNGNGENKAIDKIKHFLRREGLELLIIRQGKRIFG